MASPLTATLTMFAIQVGFPVAGILTGERMFGRTKRTRKFRYYLGVTAFAFGGWYLSNYFTTKYLENVEITFGAESKMDNCPVCKGEVYGDMSMIGEEIVADVCGDCDIYIMPQGISCIECGFGDTYGSATPCESCEPIAEKMEKVNKSAESAKDPRIVGLASVYPNPDFHYKDLDGRGYIPTGTNMTKEIAVRVKNWLRDMEGRGFSYIIREDSHNVRYDEEGNQFFSHFPEYIVLDVTNEDDIIDLVETDFSFASFTDDEMDDRPYMFISERFKEMYMTHHPLNTKRSSHLVRYYPAASLEDLDNLM